MNTNALIVVVTILAGLLILIGAGAMLVCGIFLFSSDARDIMGAGLGFVGGTVLLGSGTVSLSVVAARAAQAPPDKR